MMVAHQFMPTKSIWTNLKELDKQTLSHGLMYLLVKHLVSKLKQDWLLKCNTDSVFVQSVNIKSILNTQRFLLIMLHRFQTKLPLEVKSLLKLI